MQQDSSAKKFSYDLDNISYNLFKKMNLFVLNLSKFLGLFIQNITYEFRNLLVTNLKIP